jgi:hypothetical protein
MLRYDGANSETGGSFGGNPGQQAEIDKTHRSMEREKQAPGALVRKYLVDVRRHPTLQVHNGDGNPGRCHGSRNHSSGLV